MKCSYYLTKEGELVYTRPEWATADMVPCSKDGEVLGKPKAKPVEEPLVEPTLAAEEGEVAPQESEVEPVERAKRGRRKRTES